MTSPGSHESPPARDTASTQSGSGSSDSGPQRPATFDAVSDATVSDPQRHGGPNDVDDDADRPPTFERFDVVGSIGRGGMGIVYEVVDRERGVRLALKRLLNLHPRQVVRFKREFRALRDLRHPNLVSLDELFEEDGRWYFTMELVSGVDFLAYVRADGHAEADDTQKTKVIAERDGSSTDREPPSVRSHAAAAKRVDFARFRQSLLQLTHGLDHLHRAGKVHRDVKPSNILVTAEGRVVLLDLGVVAEMRDGGVDPREIVGTYAYMAPEQSRGEAVGPAADWYAVGVLSYIALTGRHPADSDTSLEPIDGPKVADPVPSMFPGDTPRDLEGLCRRLLEPDPTHRAGAAEILSALGQTTTPELDDCFVGRTAELAVLSEAFERSTTSTAIVLIEGDSGIGKSALVDVFAERVRRITPEVVVLRGRCHERERVPYNALDGVVDGLGRLLAALDDETLGALVDPNTIPLMQVFPALAAVEPFETAARSTRAASPTDDPRSRAFTGLRDLLRRLGDRRRLLVVLDDIQWADADSIALLDELTTPPSGPRLTLVGVAQRPPDRARCAAIERLAPRGRTLELLPLGPADARTMASRLLARLPARLAPESIARSAAGHPMFIEQLVQYATTAASTEGVVPELERAIVDRAGALGSHALRVLEVVAATGAPLQHRAAGDACGLEPEAYAAAVGALVNARLVRSIGSRDRDTLETYHYRIRRSIYAEIDDERRRDIHLSIARALERIDAAPEAIAIHFAQTDDAERAAHYSAKAAARAAAALAFDRAAELYRSALAYEVHAQAERRGLLVALGDVLADAGRPEEAASAYAQAVALGAEGSLRLELQRRAAHQLLAGGYLDQGLDAADRVLREIGQRLPRRDAAFLARLLYSSTRLQFSRLRWSPTKAEDLPPDVLTRMDVEWSVGAGLSMVDTFRGALFFARSPLLCLRHGEPFRICRSLSAASISASSLARREQAERLVQATRDAARIDGSELARFYELIAVHAKGFLLDNDWIGCLQGAQRAAELWRAAGRGRGWEFDVVQQFACWSLNMMGEYAELQRRVPQLVRAARRTGDRFQEVSLRSFFATLWLFRDDPETARQELDDAMRGWISPDRAFGNQHYWAVRGRTYTSIYQGDIERDEPELEAAWHRVSRSLVARVAVIAMETAAVCGDWAVARARAAKRRGSPSEVKRHLATARMHIRRLERSPMIAARPAAIKLRAAMAGVQGDDARAIECLRQAIPFYVEGHSHGMAASARRRLGQLIGGDEGEAMIREADAFLRAQQIASPARFGSTLLAGWD